VRPVESGRDQPRSEETAVRKKNFDPGGFHEKIEVNIGGGYLGLERSAERGLKMRGVTLRA